MSPVAIADRTGANKHRHHPSAYCSNGLSRQRFQSRPPGASSGLALTPGSPARENACDRLPTHVRCQWTAFSGHRCPNALTHVSSHDVGSSLSARASGRRAFPNRLRNCWRDNASTSTMSDHSARLQRTAQTFNPLCRGLGFDCSTVSESKSRSLVDRPWLVAAAKGHRRLRPQRGMGNASRSLRASSTNST